jgi:CheY-like chemotaxis protein
VITDIQMPGGSGLELLREVQSRANGDAETVVIVMTRSRAPRPRSRR